MADMWRDERIGYNRCRCCACGGYYYYEATKLHECPYCKHDGKKLIASLRGTITKLKRQLTLAKRNTRDS